MFATLFSVALFIALAVQGVFADDFTITTPSLVECQNVQITWTASSAGPPYNLLVVPADDVCGEAIVDLGDQTGLSLNWTVNLAPNTQAVFSLEDSQGNEAWSGTMTVAASGNSSCLTTATTTSSSASSTGTTLTVPASHTSSATGSTYSPAGAANAGEVPASGALSIRPLSALTSVGSVLLALIAFAL